MSGDRIFVKISEVDKFEKENKMIEACTTLYKLWRTKF